MLVMMVLVVCITNLPHEVAVRLRGQWKPCKPPTVAWRNGFLKM